MAFSYCFIITQCCVVGLKLTLDIQVDQYIVDLAENAGIRLLIHNPNNMPFIEDEGLSLAPGRANLIGVRKVLHKLSMVKVSLCWSYFVKYICSGLM